MMLLILIADADADSRDVGHNSFHAAVDEISVLCNTAGITHRPTLKRRAFDARCKRFTQHRGRLPVVRKSPSTDEACEQILVVHGNRYGFDARHNADPKGIQRV
jgi:hypothetical protein